MSFGGAHGPRKRDRFRALWSSSDPTSTSPRSSERRSPLPTASSISPASARTARQSIPATLAQAQAGHSANSDILDRALQRLSEKERLTIQSCIAPNLTDVDPALRQALEAARTQQKAWSQKRWAVTLGTKEIVLREQADKVADWINKVVPVGDAAAAIDPVHAGLPWAGFKLLLETSTSDSKQMAVILNGCETALYTADRLKVYLEYAQDLPPSQAHDNLTETLVEFYAAILGFLARAIQVYQTNTVRRMVTAMWTVDEINGLVSQCNAYRSKAHDDATACELALRAHDKKMDAVYKKNLDGLLGELKQWRDISRSIRRLEINIDLDRLPYADGAMFGSFGESVGDCHPGTRVDLLDQIKQWAVDFDAPAIFWLHGKAGMGKSTICRTVARWLDSQDLLNASFFFKRGGGDCETARRFCPTVVRQLIQKIPELASSIADIIDHDPLIIERQVKDQFEKLIHHPVSQMPTVWLGGPMRIVVIDALDECNDAKDIATILKQWSLLKSTTPNHLKLFVTSRPEISMCKIFEALTDDIYLNVDLHQIPDAVYSQDLATFLTGEFRDIRTEHNKQTTDDTLGDNWPGADDLEALVHMSHPLFVVAATAIRFVKNHYDPEQQLKILLKNRGLGQMSQLDQLYTLVMDQALASLIDAREDKEIALQDFMNILGCIVTLAEPLSRSALSALIKMPQKSITFYLCPLQSVLVIPAEQTIPIRPFHLSFVQFLLNRSFLGSAFRIDGQHMQNSLFTRCIELMTYSGSLCEDICQVSHPGTQREDVEDIVISKSIPTELQYACRFWEHHLQLSGEIVTDNGPLLSFLHAHALHWLEAMTWIDRVFEAASTVQLLHDQSALLCDAPQLLSFLRNLHQFVLRNQHMIHKTSLQLYSSAIIFAPSSNELRKACGYMPDWILTPPVAPVAWDPEDLVVEDLENPNSDWTFVMSFSHAGHFLASGHKFGQAIVWHRLTGARLGTMKDLEHQNSFITALAFSSDDTELVTVSDECSIVRWDLRSKEPKNSWSPDSITSNMAAISSDASLVAFQRETTSLCIRNLSNGHSFTIFHENLKRYSGLVFSSDNKSLALIYKGEQPYSIGIWSMSSLKERLRLTGHRETLKVLAFSHDNELIASVGAKGEITIWNTTRGDVLSRFVRQREQCSGLTFSQDNELLIVAYCNDIVLALDSKTGNELKRFEGHLWYTTSVAFSPVDWHSIASASWGGTIQLRVLPSISEHVKLTHSPDPICDIFFLPHCNNQFISVAEGGKIVLWDIANSACVGGRPTMIHQFHLSIRDVKLVAHSPLDTSLVALLDYDSPIWNKDYTVCIRFWDLDTGCERYKTIEYPSTSCNVREPAGWMFFSSLLDSTLITVDTKGSVRVWDLKNSQQLSLSQLNHPGAGNLRRLREYSVELSPVESHKLALVESNRNVWVFDINTGELLLEDLSHIEVKSLQWNSESLGYTLTVNRGRPESVRRRLELSRNWILKDGRKLLWIPPAYRHYKKIAHHDDSVVILCPDTGGVTFIKIDISSDSI